MQVPQQAPHPQQYPPPNSSQPNLSSLPYPVSDAPPPYTAFQDHPRPNSQPPPQNRVHFHQNGYPQSPVPGSYYPPPAQNGGYQYPPEKQGQRPPLNTFRPQSAQSPYLPQQPESQAGYPFPNGQPPTKQQPYSNMLRQSSTPGYQPPLSSYKDNDDYNSRSRSRSRSKSRDRRKHRHHHHRPPMEKKKRSGVSTFLGAGGGALIGDAIFPGLGTLGGAILGGVGGHEYGKQRRSYSNPSRTRDSRYSDESGYGDAYGRGRGPRY